MFSTHQKFDVGRTYVTRNKILSLYNLHFGDTEICCIVCITALDMVDGRPNTGFFAHTLHSNTSCRTKSLYTYIIFPLLHRGREFKVVDLLTAVLTMNAFIFMAPRRSQSYCQNISISHAPLYIEVHKIF